MYVIAKGSDESSPTSPPKLLAIQCHAETNTWCAHETPHAWENTSAPAAALQQTPIHV